MGISVDLWRARIGSFGSLAAHPTTCVPVRCTRHRLLCVIAYLLLIGCVELNPGPPKFDVHALEKRLDDFAIEVRATRADAQQERQALGDQLAIFSAETNRKLTALEGSLVSAMDRIATLERSLNAANTTIAELKAAAGTQTPAAGSTGTPPILPPVQNVAAIVDEVRERAIRSKNVVVTGIKADGHEDAMVAHILSNELHLTSTAVSCTRLGGGTARRPAPLLVTFASPTEASAVIKVAKSLRSSTDADIKSTVYISPDYTKLERKEQYNLRVELRRRKAAGEGDLIIRRGSVIPRPQRETP